MLTSAQLATLKADILATPALAAQPMTPDGDYAIAAYYNATAQPAYTVWKTNVTITQVGDNIVASELAGLTANNLTRLQTIAVYSPGGINPSLPDRRAFFSDVFSGAGGALTRPKLDVLWRRLATTGEKLYATGSGTDPAPSTMVMEGDITAQNVNMARSLP